MSGFLRDYERKRRRAMLHYNVLRELVEGFTDSNRHRVRGEFQHDTSKHVFQLPLEPVDPDFAIVLGDFLYNTRSSLDYLITALIRSTGKEEHNTSQFPIYTPNGIGWEHINQWWDTSNEVTRKLKDTPPGTQAALKQLQPFYGIPATNPFGHPLSVLNELNNRDKHRRLNLLAHRASIDFVDASGQPVFEHGTPLYNRIPQRDEGETYSVSLVLRPDQANMDVYLLATYQVMLDEPPHVFGELVEMLTGINQFIDGRVLPVVKGLL